MIDLREVLRSIDALATAVERLADVIESPAAVAPPPPDQGRAEPEALRLAGVPVAVAVREASGPVAGLKAQEPIAVLQPAAIAAMTEAVLGPAPEVAAADPDWDGLDVSEVPVCAAGPDPFGGLYCELAPNHRGYHRSASTSWQ